MNKIQFDPQIPPLTAGEARKADNRSRGPESFATVLEGLFNDVNSLKVNADKTIEKLNTGEIEDVHQAVVAAEEADVAFRMMMEIRNKLLEAYQEVMRMQV